MKKIIPIVIICCLLSACSLLDRDGSLKNLREFTQDTEGNIFSGDLGYIHVYIPDLYVFRCEEKPFGYINDNDENKQYPRIYAIRGIENNEWIYAHQFGLMMGWGDLYRKKDTLEFDFSTFEADEIQLSKGGIPSPLEDDKIIETISDGAIVASICNIINQDECTGFEGKQLDYLRTVYILSSKYKGLNFVYILQRDDQNNTYLSNTTEYSGYLVNEIFGYIS